MFDHNVNSIRKKLVLSPMLSVYNVIQIISPYAFGVYISSIVTIGIVSNQEVINDRV